MTVAAYTEFAGLVRRRTGIVISDDKQYLVDARLTPYAQTGGYATVEALLRAVVAGRDARLLNLAVDAMTTNETLFFRDATPFTALAAIMKRHAAAPNAAPLRIWSAACSTGQEAYSIAMTAAEVRETHPDLKVEIVASDLSARCVERARQGAYSQFEVQRGVSMHRLVRHFEQCDQSWRVRPVLSRDITWKVLNIMEPFTALGVFDIVFCRNVLFYFDIAERRSVLERISRQLHRDGRLFLGVSENVLGVTQLFAQAKDGVGFTVIDRT